jgi:phage repressor protein C with HTH and peptisase S24 domain
MQRFIAVIAGDSMWPTHPDGDRLLCSSDTTGLTVGSIIFFKHPLRSSLNAVKRIVSIEGDSIFVQGDNPDPLASDDSHNFGSIQRSEVIGVMLKPVVDD